MLPLVKGRSRLTGVFVTLVLVGTLVLGISPATDAAVSPELQRYPYLTDLVGGSVTVNFGTVATGTDAASVKWGPLGSCTANTVAATRLSSFTVNGASRWQWKATISGLAGDTQYCYRVFKGTTDLLGTDGSPTFRTQVPAGSSTPYTFVVFGDWGLGSPTGNSHQTNLFNRMATTGARFALSTGDVPYGSGQTAYGDLTYASSGVFGTGGWPLAGKSIAMFNALGNHGRTLSSGRSTHIENWPSDTAVSTSGGRYRIDSYPSMNGTNPASYPSAWYAFNAGQIRFYILDTSWSDGNVGTADVYKNDYDQHWQSSSAEYQWLKSDLEANPGKAKVAVFHFPPWSANTSGEPSDTWLQGASSLEGLLTRNGVKLAFNGHAHHYERNKPSALGLTTYISGGGGATLHSIPSSCSSAIQAFTAYAISWSTTSNTGQRCPSSVPVPTSANQVYHFIKVAVNGTNVTLTPTNENGQTFDVQTYDLSGGGGGDTTPPSAPTGLSATAVSANQVDLSWTASTDNVGVTNYEIYRDGALVKTVGNVTSTSDTTVAASTSYAYTVKALDAAGNRSAASNTANVTTPAAGATQTRTFSPTADSYVQESTPGTNYGTSTNLRADGGADPDVDSYLRFNVSGVTGTVQSAKLRVYAWSGTANGPALFGTDAGWSETGITWSNRPARNASATDDKGSIAANTWVEYNVAPLVTGDGDVSFGLIPQSSDGVDFYAKETTTVNKPELVVTFSDGGGGEDTTAPTVSMTAPANGAAVRGASVTVSANASDNVGVVGVQFKDGTNNIGAEDTTAPYSVTWDTTGLTEGTHTLTAVARDAATNSTTSAPVNVTVDNTQPTVTITSPADSAEVSDTINVDASAADTGGSGVLNVQFKLDGANLGAADPSAPYSVSWNTTTATNGPHTLTAVATDRAGNTKTSTQVNVTVNNAAPSGPAFVRQATGTTATATLSANIGATAGDALVASVALQAGSSKSVLSVTDSTGGTWTKGPIGYLSGANTRVEMWYRLNVPSGITSVTATLSAAAAASMNVSEWSGVATAGALDGSGAQGNASATTASTPNITTTNATDVVIGAINYPAAATSTPTTPNFTSLNDFNSGSGVHGRAAYRIVSSTGTYGVSWNLSAASASGAAILALKGSGGGPPPPVDNPPSVSVTAPAAGSTVSGATVSLEATASDDLGVASVQFKVDGTNVGAADTTFPYQVNWDSTAVPNGSHTVTAVATDTGSQSTTSSGVSVTVDNGGPPPPGNITFVRQATGSTTTASLAVPVSATAAGNTLVASIALQAGSSKSVTAVTDSAGGTWTRGPFGFLSGSNTRIEIWYRTGVGAGVTSVTATLSAAAAASANVSEWSGVATAGALDGSGAQGNASATTASTPNITTTNANDVVIGAINYPAAANSTLTTPNFTSLADFNSGSGVHGRAAYRIVTATGGYQVSWSLSAASASGGALLALKAA